MNKVFIIPLLLLLSCGGGKLNDRKYEKTKKDIEKQERKYPLNFLAVKGAEKKNLIAQLIGQTVVTGTVRNNASVCSYEDVRIKMLFYKAGNLTENHEEVIKGIVSPHNELEFRSKYSTSRAPDSIALSIMSATAVK